MLCSLFGQAQFGQDVLMPSAGHNATICTCSTMQMSSSQWHCMTHNVMLQLGLYRHVVGMSTLQPQ